MNESTTTQSLVPLAPPQDNREVALFSTGGFELAQRMATALSKATFVPEQFRNNIPNCLIALEMANRIGASPMSVMQHLYVVHGKPAWSSQFVIAAINSTKRFSPLRFDLTGDGDKRACIAWATELSTNQRLDGPPVSIAMAKSEGWFSKNGSKWQTMPELMLRYRAATFFGRIYAPEVLMGMKEETEVLDVEATVSPSIPRAEIAAPSSDTVVEIEPGKATPRGKGKKGAAPSKAEQLEAKVRDAGYTVPQLLRVAIDNKFIDPPAGYQADDPRSLDDVPLASVGDEKLAMWLEDWEDLLIMLRSGSGKTAGAGNDDALFPR